MESDDDNDKLLNNVYDNYLVNLNWNNFDDDEEFLNKVYDDYIRDKDKNLPVNQIFNYYYF